MTSSPEADLYDRAYIPNADTLEKAIAEAHRRLDALADWQRKCREDLTAYREYGMALSSRDRPPGLLLWNAVAHIAMDAEYPWERPTTEDIAKETPDE